MHAPAPQPTRMTRLYPWYVVGVLLLINALSYLDRQVMSILVSPIQADLGFSDTQIGLLLGPAFMVFFVLAGMPMGRIADQHNRARLLCFGVLVWSAGTVFTGLSNSFAGMMVSRAAVGLGEACVVPAAFSLIADYFAPEKRGRAASWVTVGLPIGAASALFGGGMMLKWADGLNGAALPLIGARAPWEIVLVSFGAVGIVVALLTLTLREPRRAAVPGVAPAGEVAGFTPFLRRYKGPLTLILLPYVLLTYMQVAIILWVPTLLTRRHGMDPADAATLYGVITLTIPVLAATTGGWIADWLLRRHAAGPFLLVTWLSPLYLPGVLFFTLGQSLPMAVLGLCIISLVGGVCSTTVYASIQNVAPAQFRGRILALFNLLAQLAGIGLGPLLVALVTDNLFADRSMLHLAMIVAVAPACVVTSICGVIGRRHFAAMRALTQ